MLSAVLGAGITKINDNSHNVNSLVKEIGKEINYYPTDVRMYKLQRHSKKGMSNYGGGGKAGKFLGKATAKPHLNSRCVDIHL